VVPVKLLILSLLFTIMSGCQLPYLWHAGTGQLSILWNRTPIEEVLKDQNIDEATKAKLRLIGKVKRYSEETLGLVKTDNYQDYVLLDRDHVSYLLSASKKDELKAYRWSFPIVGSFPYLGFYDIEMAKEYQQELIERDHDTYLRGVSAYSTLGWFDDPVLSSMMRGGDESIVEVVIHESVHATLFIEDHVSFNERLATFLGRKGAIKYYQDSGQNLVANKLMDQENDFHSFSRFLKDVLEWAENEYKKETSDASLEEKRQRIFETLKKKYQMFASENMESTRYDWFKEAELNNARLIALKVYLKDVSPFEQAYSRCGKSIKKLLSAIEFLKNSENPEADFTKWVNQPNMNCDSSRADSR
jgi:predicted aminopeptidase